jgi:membrane-bound lytic murein transglycosylase D
MTVSKLLKKLGPIVMVATVGSFPAGFGLHQAFAGAPSPALEGPALEGEESPEELDSSEPLATEKNPAARTGDLSLVPRVDELLQLKPRAGNSAARFADLLNPPAEVATAQSDAGAATELSQYNVPIVVDPSVQDHIRYFNTAIRGKFEQWLLRLSRYRPLVEPIFLEFNLPSDLVFLSLVESGFNPYAYSRAKATGPWQFMQGTAKVYGLRVDQYVDERRDPIKSTIAAARYLRDLYDLFGTWPLAMAAYNAGEGKVMRALHKAQAESFSEIARTKLIRRETREYVPRFMAATIIAKNPDRYGFPQDTVPPHQFEEVVVSRPMHFAAVANATGISYQELRLLNPELRRDATPPDDHTYHLKVPIGTKTKVEALLDKIPTWKFPPLPAKSQRVKQDTTRWYKVRVGDNLEKVAKRFGLSVKALKARNNLSGPVIRPGDFLVIAR